MPYPNFHSCRIKEPDLFQSDSFRTLHTKTKGLTFISGKLKSTGKSEVQSFRYDKKEWDKDRAATHCDSQNGNFEEAVSKSVIKDIQFELDIVKSSTTVKTGDRIVCGYASTFDVDTDNMQITRTALEKAKNDLLQYSTVLFNHDTSRPIGKTIETFVDDIGLFVKIVLSKTEDEIWKKIKEGIINKFSIRGRVASAESSVVDPSQLRQVNDIELFEVSLVSVPANKEAQTICHYIAKSLAMGDETQEDSKEKMLVEKLNELLKKDEAGLREGVTEILKEFEEVSKAEDDLVTKLQVIAGKLIAEDKQVLDDVIEILKKKKNYYDESRSNQKTSKDFDLADESETRPVFQISTEVEEMKLEEGSPNRFRKQILKYGKWYHWDADGGVLNVTDEVVENIIKNFKKGVIEHVFVPLTHTNDPSKNTGEIIELVKTAEGLDAIIEVKDEAIADKIAKGLIKCVSASLDPNYRIKKTNKFAGATLLHAALVSEPYIKGMGSFVALTEEFSGRNVIQLEDTEPSFLEIMKALKNSLEESIDEKTNANKEMFAEEFAKIKVEFGKQNELEKIEEIKEENKEIEIPEDVEKTKYQDCMGREMKAGKTMDEAVKICKVEAAKTIEKQAEPKEGDPCVTDKKKKGKYAKEGDALICKALSDDEIKDLEKSKFQDCMSREMKAGKSMADAAKMCKGEATKEVEKMFPEATSGEQPEDKSGDPTPQIDLAEVERVYEGYLKAGKIVPAQKDAFIKLMTSGKTVELGDNQVDVSELLKAFMESQTSSINFDESGAPLDEGKDGTDGKKIVEGADLSDVPTDAKEFFGKMGISSPEAIKKSWTNLQELKKEKDDEKSGLFS